MRRRELDAVRPGDVLARTVHDDLGRPLLTAGTTLTERYLGSLRRRGYYAIDVQDGLADDVAPRDLITHRVRATITTHVSEVFDRVTEVAVDRGRGRGSVGDAVRDLGEQPLPAAGTDDAVGALYADVETLIDEILEAATVEGLDSLKTHNRYTFEHSVDVAVVGTLIGVRMRMPRHRLRELALGCLLHDIGKTYIDTAILDKPGQLTAEEFTAVQEHPRMGYEIIRRLPVASLLPAHVAYQHHERQQGGGYPRGLIGTNRVGPRLAGEVAGARHMLLIAEIGAVADVHSALSSDRPYRAALPPDQVDAALVRMAGRHLNVELVEVLRRLLPPFPVGRWVEAVDGALRGHRGVVVQVHPRELERPTVRWLLDDRGEELALPLELDLRRPPHATLRCADPVPVLV
jgi:HD-GYP domain-containing protein (c-di-GMP phosphodiesterase class II)